MIPSLPPVTPAESAALQQRKTALPVVHELYQTWDYLHAYSRHTDMRVQYDGPAAAIGGDWEAGGQRQLHFLKAHGVTPESRVLDFGCGTGRLARWLVPYLEPGHYTGMDLSVYALVALQTLAHDEGWEAKGFTLLDGDGTFSQVAGNTYDVIIAYAVFIHLPVIVIEAIFESLQHVTFGRMWFTYKPSNGPRRTALKQFCAPLSLFQEMAQKYGYRIDAVSGKPYLPQPLALLRPE